MGKGLGKPSRLLLVVGLGLGLFSDIYRLSSALAESNQTRPLSFVYVHGVNNHGEKRKENLYKKFSDLHNSLLFRLANEPLAPTIFDIDHVSQIEKEPKIFYWYELSQDSVNLLHSDLAKAVDIRKKKPGVAALVQKNLASMLQDVFWLLTPSNQVRINVSLHNFIQQEVPKDNKIVLFGYSGGSIIDLNYLLNYLPFIDLQEVAAGKNFPTRNNFDDLPSPVQTLLNKPEVRHTCLRALLEKQIVRYDSNGDPVFFMNNLNLGEGRDMASLRNQYLLQMLPQLAEANQSLCLPGQKLKGLVTFGSPLAALSERLLQSSQGYLYLALIRYFINEDIFWLNLNQLNDPLGYSIPVLRIENLLKEHYALDSHSPTKGFIYSDVLFQYHVYFYSAHLWYLKHPVIFSNALVDNLKKGYLNHLDR